MHLSNLTIENFRCFGEGEERFDLPMRDGLTALVGENDSGKTTVIDAIRFALVTTAGLYLKDKQPPFDLDRERREPGWGDPSYRAIPSDARQEQIGVGHLHINTEDIEADVNIVLPVHRFQELAAAGEVGEVAPHHYSFMGYQQDNSHWREHSGPAVAQRMVEEQVDAALLIPA